MSSPKMLATLFELLTVGEIMPSHIDEKIRTSSGHEMFVTEKTFSILFPFIIIINCFHQSISSFSQLIVQIQSHI